MDFTGRGSQPAQPAATNSQYSGGTNAGSKKNKSGKGRDWTRIGAAVFGFLLLVLVVGVIVSIAAGGKNKEGSYVDKDRLQAVFLQTGQVYFGDIKVLNDNFIELENIYYLQTSNGDAAASTASNANVSLVKLGCELHAPFDRMIINHDQVTFWENLQADGQVAKAVETFEKDNPNGQKCADQSTAPNSNSNVQGTQNTQNAGTSNTSNTNSSDDEE